MNKQLVESIYQVIRSLSIEDRSLLEEKLFTDLPYPNQKELISLIEAGKAFEFLNSEPDIYSLEDGEPIEWD
jgi:hypothetical protein